MRAQFFHDGWGQLVFAVLFGQALHGVPHRPGGGEVLVALVRIVQDAQIDCQAGDIRHKEDQETDEQADQKAP